MLVQTTTYTLLSVQAIRPGDWTATAAGDTAECMLHYYWRFPIMTNVQVRGLVNI